MFFKLRYFSLIVFTFLYLKKHVPQFHGGVMAGFILWARFVRHRCNCLYCSLLFSNIRCFFCVIFLQSSLPFFLQSYLPFFNCIYLSLMLYTLYFRWRFRGFMAVSWRCHGRCHTLGSICEPQEYFLYFSIFVVVFVYLIFFIVPYVSLICFTFYLNFFTFL